MKRTIILPMLTLGVLALAACANDKPASDASQTTTTSARAPDGLMSSNPNDTNATGAAMNTSPDPSMTNTTTGSNSSATNNVQNTHTGSPGDTAQIPQTRSHSTNGHDVGWGPGTTSPAAGTDGNAAGASQPVTTAPPPPPSNTNGAQAQNGGTSPTPIDQGNNKADLKITQQIRKAVVSDSSLSFAAKNVTIITQNGRVTLRGQVKSDDEKKWVEATADKVVGSANVDNQLQVKP